MISPVKIQENINGALQDLITVSDIIETGDNANGYYLRFTDGTQVCWMYFSVALPASSNSVVYNGTFPAAFDSVPVVVSGTYRQIQGGAMAFAVPLNTSTTTFQIQLVSIGNNFGQSLTAVFNALAIGRWK